MEHISQLKLQGYKSIKDLKINFENINIFIGGNGAGKSNLLSFFGLLKNIGNLELQNTIMKQGGAERILYNGKKVTDQIYFVSEFGHHAFYARLVPAQGDTMILGQQGLYDISERHTLYASDGFRELKDSGLVKKFHLLDQIEVYHFHDTSPSSPMKSSCSISDNERLLSDGRNIAAVLYRISKQYPDEYQQIVDIVNMVAPYFKDFCLRPNPLQPSIIQLEWYKNGSESVFNADQLSDGTLRFIVITTLLNIPEEMCKNIVCIDEPELGMHPYAITLLSEMIKKYASRHQIFIATQSTDFINEFSASQLIITEEKNGETFFQRLDEMQLAEWLSEYSLGDLWKKNVIGGRP